MKSVILGLLVISNIVLATEKKEPHAAYELFHQGYLVNEDNQDIFYILAANVISTENSSVGVTQVVEKLQIMLKEEAVQKKYIESAEASFTKEDMVKMKELLECPLYQKYHKQLEQFLMVSHTHTMQLMGEIVASKDIVSTAEKSVELTSLHKDNVDTFLKSSKFAVVDVYADWCAPCRYMEPIIKELASQYANQYAFGKLNAEHEEQIAKDWQVSGLPTLLFFKDGKLIGRHVGFASKDKIEKILKNHFST